MNRVVQSIVGIVLLMVAAAVALASVTSKGAVVMTWEVVAVVLAFATVGGFMCSKSLMVEMLSTVAKTVKRSKPVAP